MKVCIQALIFVLIFCLFSNQCWKKTLRCSSVLTLEVNKDNISRELIKWGAQGRVSHCDNFLSVCFAERSCYLKTQEDYKGYFSR